MSAQLIDTAPVRALLAGEHALTLLAAGPVLPDEYDSDWAQDARAEYDSLLRAARHAAAGAALSTADSDTARQIAEAAVRADRFDESAHRLLMAAHQAAGDPNRALVVYQGLRAALADELGVDPAPQTRRAHETVLRQAGFADPLPLTVDSGSRIAQVAQASPARAVGPEKRELVGRDAELGRLTGAWAAAGRGDPAMLLIAGEGGIGKTRLAAELTAIAESEGALVLSARCYASEQSLFLQPLVDAITGALSELEPAQLRALAGPWTAALAGLLPELAGALGPMAREQVSADVALRRIHEALTAVLRGLAAARPVLLLLDDLHNAGLATVEVLHYLARHCPGARLLVLVTVRVEEGQTVLDALADVSSRLDLGPLPAEAVARLAAGAGRSELAETILRRTRGHTLFVIETLRGLDAGEAGAPESLQAVVLARLRRAGAATEELLRAGAVLGATVDPVTVAGLLGLTPHTAAVRCEQAAAARLLHVAGRAYEFANDLVQEMLYTTTRHRLGSRCTFVRPTCSPRGSATIGHLLRRSR